MRLFLDRHVGEFPKKIGVIHLNHGDCTAVAGYVDTAQARVIFHDVAATGERQILDDLVLFEIEYSQEIILFADEEGSVPLGVQGHAVVSTAPAYRILREHEVVIRINEREEIDVLEIDVDNIDHRVV